jgi:drug/metabolite transporter (DMT)-like permease
MTPAPSSDPRDRTLLGIALTLCAMAILPVIDVFAKKLGEAGLPVVLIVWGRAAFSTLGALPFALGAAGPAAFRPQRPLVHLLRAVLLFSATFFFFQALKTLPIADALAIFFVNPLIVVVLSALVLREPVGPRRWAAVAVGLAGTLVILRPGFQTITPGMLWALAAGVSLGTYFVVTRAVAGQMNAMVMMFQTSAIGTVLLFPLTLAFWVAPTPSHWAMLAGLGLVAMAAHYLITRAYELADASLLAPFAFTEIISATLLGWVFFDDWPDRWTITGVTILIASAVFISWRERQATLHQRHGARS